MVDYILTDFHLLVKSLSEKRKAGDKEQALFSFLSDRPAFIELLRYVYDPFILFYLTHNVGKKGSQRVIRDRFTILDALRALSEKKVTGNAARSLWREYLENVPCGMWETAGKILDKDLNCGVGLKTINKVFLKIGVPLIYEYEVAKGEKWEGQPIWEGKNWYASRKYDGIRISCHFGSCTPPSFISTGGLSIETLGVLQKILLGYMKKFPYRGGVLDGEVGLLREDDEDDFQGIHSQIRRKDYTIPNPVFHIFDWIPRSLDEKTNPIFHMRQSILNEIVEELGSSNFVMVKQTLISSEKRLLRLMDRAKRRGWEGLILRKDAPYVSGRSKDILKVKDFSDMEVKVEDILYGPMRISIEEEGKKVWVEKKKVMTAAVISYKGNKVSVGSGWTPKQRMLYAKHPEKIIGKVITVQYFEESKNKKGTKSLRFPTVKCVHGKKRYV